MVSQVGKRGRPRKVEKKGKLRGYVSWWPSAVADMVGVVGGGVGLGGNPLPTLSYARGERARHGYSPARRPQR